MLSNVFVYLKPIDIIIGVRKFVELISTFSSKVSHNVSPVNNCVSKMTIDVLKLTECFI